MIDFSDSKTIQVYTQSSYIKFPGYMEEHTIEIDSKNNLIINKRDQTTGEERMIATFKYWEYFTID